MQRPQLGLIGYGAFGKLTAQHLSQWFEVRAFDPHLAADDDYATAVSLEEAASCPVVILAVPVGVLEQTLADITPMLSQGALVLDVGSVKVKPADLMQRILPDHIRIVGTHPLFGPQSAKNGLKGLRMAISEVRGAKDARRIAAWCRKVLGLKVFNVTPEDHDREAATVQGLTHMIAKVLLKMEPLPTRMTTASFERLMQGVDMVRHDSPAVYQAIERDNPFAAGVRERFFDLFDQARSELDGRAD